MAHFLPRLVQLGILTLSITAWPALPATAWAAQGQDQEKPAVAADAPTVKPWKGDVYPLDTDPVTGQKLGDKPVIYSHQGRELRFTSQESLKEFQASPDKYLSRLDERLIAQQKPYYPLDTCVVSGQKLDSMGKTVDRIYNNRLVRFCCAECPAAFAKDPGKYIAKLDQAAIEKQKKDYPLNTCVVSGEQLGGDMGEPVDVVFNNRLVRFCCRACVGSFQKEPAKYLSQIEKAKANKGGSSTQAAKSAQEHAIKGDAHQH